MVFVFVIVFVFVFVFVFVIVFFLVRSYLLITLIKCLKGHKSPGSLCCCVFQKVPYSLTQWVSEWVSDKVIYWAVGWTAKNINSTYLHVLICILASANLHFAFSIGAIFVQWPKILLIQVLHIFISKLSFWLENSRATKISISDLETKSCTAQEVVRARVWIYITESSQPDHTWGDLEW